MTREELSELMTSWGYEDSIVFENPSYLNAIIAISDTGRVCYDHEKMIECLLAESDDMSYEDALEFISYNTERALQYEPLEKRPIIVYPLNE